MKIEIDIETITDGGETFVSHAGLIHLIDQISDATMGNAGAETVLGLLRAALMAAEGEKHASKRVTQQADE